MTDDELSTISRVDFVVEHKYGPKVAAAQLLMSAAAVAQSFLDGEAGEDIEETHALYLDDDDVVRCMEFLNSFSVTEFLNSSSLSVARHTRQ